MIDFVLENPQISSMIAIAITVAVADVMQELFNIQGKYTALVMSLFLAYGAAALGQSPTEKIIYDTILTAILIFLGAAGSQNFFVASKGAVRGLDRSKIHLRWKSMW